MRSRSLFRLIVVVAILLFFSALLLALRPPPPSSSDVPAPTQPAQTLPLEELLALSFEIGHAYGLETIESHVYAWVTKRDYMRELGSPEWDALPLLVVAMKGSGTWMGVGFVPLDFKLEGITVALNGINGDVVVVTGGYQPPGTMLPPETQEPGTSTTVPVPPEQTAEASPLE